MSTLSEALTAAQARAINAISKSYLASHIERDEANAELQVVGATDDVDRCALLDALDTIKRYGAQAPSEPSYSERRTNDRPTSAQVTLIERLAKEKDYEPVDLTAVTRAQASEIIDTLKNGTFDPAKWSIPF